MPVVFPGGSWYNLMMSRNQPERTKNPISRLKGAFLSTQIRGHMGNGVTMIYQAMFDEIDEGTAIFKVTNDPPVGGVNRWVTYEGLVILTVVCPSNACASSSEWANSASVAAA